MIAWLLLWLLLPVQGAPCQHGELKKCGFSNTLGECRAGVQSCVKDIWGPCLCGRQPKVERCDCKDNDCDGEVDENCSCGCPGEQRACGFSPGGQCKRGVQTCVGLGEWSVCRGTVGPARERCDGKDNDCDGKVDEELSCGSCKDGDVRDCFDGGDSMRVEGECKAGMQRCQGGKWGTCVGQVGPQPEICDNKDNSCNGFVDGLVRLCGSDTGACQRGSQTCELGKWGTCRGEIKPRPELCDCQDNDCDGSVDEELATPCPKGQICYHGRCVVNCDKGRCLQPSEDSSLEPVTTEVTMREGEGIPDAGAFEPTEVHRTDALIRPDAPMEPDARIVRDVSVETTYNTGEKLPLEHGWDVPVGDGVRKPVSGCGCHGHLEQPAFGLLCLLTLFCLMRRWGFCDV